MKFQDKLSKVRKERNLSQEALAEKLGMSRQAISKWESGSSYPDMATIIRVTKVLDCKLEDLLDDDTIGVKKESNTNNFNTIIKDFLNFITKTYNMFWSMKFKDKIKCIIEILIIIFICYFASYIFGIFLKNTIFNIFNILPNNIYNYLLTLFKVLYSILMFVISFIITIHLFKIRYLDYYITIEDKNIINKTIEEDKTETKKIYNANKREKIIIRDPIHSTNKFVEILIKLIKTLLKVFTTFILLFLIITFIFITFATTISFAWIKYGIIFLGAIIVGLGILNINYILIELIYEFIFDRSYYFKRIFIMFIIGLTLIGIGFGISFNELSKFNFNYTNNYDKNTILTLDYNDNMILDDLDYYKYHNKVVIDNNQDKIIIEVLHDNNIEPCVRNSDNHYFIDYNSKNTNVIKYILKDIKNKKIDFNGYYKYDIKSITISQKNYDKLINNYNYE
mgnify:CR=1 FL=1